MTPYRMRYLWLGLFVNILIVSETFTADDFDYTCFPGISNSPGVSLPRGDINVEVNSEPIDLYCLLNPDHSYYKSGSTAENLIFSLDKKDGSEILNSRVVNDTTIIYTYVPNERTVDDITCKIDLGQGSPKGICRQTIFVGDKPLPPQNFSCISHNWMDLNCTWDEQFNPVKTTFSLFYIRPGRYGDPSDTECSGKSSISNCFESISTIGKETISLYKPEVNSLDLMGDVKFLMRRSNQFGTYTDEFVLNVESQIVRPDPANNLSLIAVSPDTLKLYYQIPHHLELFPPGLDHMIEIKSAFETEWQQLDTNDRYKHSSNVSMTIEGLHAYVEYTVKVTLRSATADPENKSLWSSSAFVKGRTEPKLPDGPPKTVLGSFEVLKGVAENRTIYVYWQQLNETARNGPNFSYKVVKVTEEAHLRRNTPAVLKESFAMFTHLSLKAHSFEITSVNEVGTAHGLSEVFVPEQDEVDLLSPRAFTKIVYDNNFYEVSWIDPKNYQDVVSYTIFWCLSENNRDRPFQCNGYLDWIEVPRTTRFYNISLPTDDIYQFAVAANTPEISSGMIWSSCTIIHNKVFGKLRTVSIDDIPTKDSVTIRWRLDCSDRVEIVNGFRIHFCPVHSNQDSVCQQEMQTVEVSDAAAEKFTLGNLQPWTFYKIGVGILTRGGESEISEYEVKRTGPSAPSTAPRNLRQNLINSKTADISWDPPLIPNGPITHYEVVYEYSDFAGEIVSKKKTVKEERSVTLNGLASYTDYSVKVQACTADFFCGDQWETIVFKTGVGASGQMPAPMVSFSNETIVQVELSEEFHHGGPRISYELKINSFDAKDQKPKIIELKPNGERSHLNLTSLLDWQPDCANESSTQSARFNFSVRAITSDGNKRYEGPWSPTEVQTSFCPSKIPWILIIVVGSIAGVIAIVLFLYSCKFYYSFYEKYIFWCNGDEDSKKRQKLRTDWIAHHIDQVEKEGKIIKQPDNWISDSVYQRAESRESSEKLLPKRNMSGGSNESRSTRSSGMDYESPSSKNLQSNTPESCGYLSVAKNDSERAQDSPGENYSRLAQRSANHDADIATGYTKMSAPANPIPQNKGASGYVTFTQVKNVSAPPQQISNGYVPVEQVKSSSPSTVSPELFDQSNTNPNTYGPASPESEANSALDNNFSSIRPDVIRRKKPLRSPSASIVNGQRLSGLSETYSQIITSFDEQGHERLSLSPIQGSDSNYVSSGYVQARSSMLSDKNPFGKSDLRSSLVISPDSLKDSRVVTPTHSSTSTMV